MEKREIGGIDVSLLGFGCMRFPMHEDGLIDMERTARLIDIAIKSGVTYFDTAYNYHGGESEKAVGEILSKYPRGSYTLATKLPVWKIEKREDALKYFNEQLEHLKTDHIDFYLLHALGYERFENTVLKFDLIPIFEQLQREGKIVKFGFSFHDSYEAFEKILCYRKWDFCQLQLNYMDMDDQAGARGLALAKRHGTDVVVMEPCKGGSLVTFPKVIASKLIDLAPEKSLAYWAMRYAGSLDGVKVVLSGMSNEEQLSDNIDTFSSFKPLSQFETALIDEMAHTLKNRIGVGCTGCKYCMPCPHGVNIPESFELLNEYVMFENLDGTRRGYSSMGEAKAENCADCGACEKMCPQKIEIRNELKRLVKIAKA